MIISMGKIRLLKMIR